MKRRFLVMCLFLVGCGDSSCEQGNPMHDCYDNYTCNRGASCVRVDWTAGSTGYHRGCVPDDPVHIPLGGETK